MEVPGKVCSLVFGDDTQQWRWLRMWRFHKREERKVFHYILLNPPVLGEESEMYMSATEVGRTV